MSGATEILGRKIASAGDLESVVRSMKALAASNISQYERAVQSLDHYYRTVELGLAACLRRAGAAAPAPPARGRTAAKAVGAIVFGSDQGLVGRFNEVLVDFVARELGRNPGRPNKVWAVGERISALLADRGLDQAGLFAVPTSVDAITPLVGQILIEIGAARAKGDVGEVYLFHNRPGSGAAYGPISKRILPLDQAWQSKLASLPWPTKSLPEVIEGTVPTLEAFMQGYFFVLLFQACAESLASENASCLASMQRAEKNIEELLEDLSRTFHRIRQESIDEELFDVISGYEALTAAPRGARP
jgi:F-type H+-transporting ATPase subunit gamma